VTRRIMIPRLVATLGLAVPAVAQEAAPPASPAATVASADVVTVRNISHVELSEGMPIFDSEGQTIGTVKKVAGNTIIITDGNADYRVPITQLYAYRDGGADRFASRIAKSDLEPAQESD
jgi:hypothetical protein